jgi:hypothetical protein
MRFSRQGTRRRKGRTDVVAAVFGPYTVDRQRAILHQISTISTAPGSKGTVYTTEPRSSARTFFKTNCNRPLFYKYYMLISLY